MPISLSNVAVQQFNDTFTNEYQAAAMLGNTTQSIYNCFGDAFKWPIQGHAVMLPRGAFQSLVPSSDVNYSQITTTFDPYVLNLPVDVFQEKEINRQIDVLTQLGSVHAKSAGRREDQIIIDALNASTPPAANVIADGGTNLSVEKLLEASAVLDNANVNPEDRFLAISANQLQALLAEDKTTSSLYVTDRNLESGRLMSFLGFNIYTLGERTEGGLPLAGAIRTCFAWQRQAVGRAYSITPTTEVDWSAAHQSWLTISRMCLGASALLDGGIVKIGCDES